MARRRNTDDEQPDGKAQVVRTEAEQNEIIARNAVILTDLYSGLDESMVASQEWRGKISAAKKVAKKDGCDVDAIVAAIKLKRRDPDEVIAEHRNMVRVLKLLDSPLGTQFDFFKDVDVKDTVDARTAGKAAGKNGENADNNPHPQGTEQHAQWREGWGEGQAALAEKMGSNGGRRVGGRRSNVADVEAAGAAH